MLFQLFTKSEIRSFRVLTNPPNVPKSTILVDQDVDYYAKSSPKKINSLLTLERNTQGLVIKHMEEWDHKHESTSEDGFFGMLNEYRKKITAELTGKAVTKDPSNL